MFFLRATGESWESCCVFRAKSCHLRVPSLSSNPNHPHPPVYCNERKLRVYAASTHHGESTPHAAHGPTQRTAGGSTAETWSSDAPRTLPRPMGHLINSTVEGWDTIYHHHVSDVREHALLVVVSYGFCSSTGSGNQTILAYIYIYTSTSSVT